MDQNLAAGKASRFRVVASLLMTVLLVVGVGSFAFMRSASAVGESFVATVGNAAAAPTNSTSLFQVTTNCRQAAGCAGATIQFQRPTAPDGTKLDGPMVISLASGANPAITYTVDNVNSDNPKLTFTRFDNSISQLFTVSWRTTDPQVVPGTYSMKWSSQLAPGDSVNSKSDTATGVVTGTAAPSLQKTVNSTGNVYNGALRTFTLNWMRPSRQSGNTGAITTIVDQLPANYTFKGFNDTNVGTDMRFRRMDGNNAVLTTEDGSQIYSYDAAKNQVIIKVTRGVDAYIAQRNNGRARISYDVQVNGGSPELADNTKLINTVSAAQTTQLSAGPAAGSALTVAPASVTLNYTRTRPGTFTKGRTLGEYMTTTSDDPNAPAMDRPFYLQASNPGTAPQDLVITDNTSWSVGNSAYRYLTRVSLDPVVFNGGRVDTYGATVIGKRLDGSTQEYKVIPNQVLTIPAEDKIVNAEIRVPQLAPMDALPETADNGILRINLNYAVRIESEEITGPNPQEGAPSATQFANTASFNLGGKNMGSQRAFYTFYAKLPNLTPTISVRGLDTGTNFNLVRNQWFNATVGLYANSDSSPAHPEAFMVLPVGFTLGANPQFTDTGEQGCKPASAWQFEKMAPYNGSERWRIWLKDSGDTLQPVDGSRGIYCYNLRISSGNAQSNTYDKNALTDPLHNIGLWLRERNGNLSNSTMTTTDTYDINSDGNTGGRWRSASLSAGVASTTGIGVTKTASGDVSGPTSWVSGVNEDASVARKKVDFTVTASTTGTTAVKDLVLYDMLPNANNVGDNWKRLVEGATTDYSDATSFSPDLTGPVTAVDHTKSFTAWYTTAANPCRPELAISGTNWPDNSCPTFNAKNEWTTDLSTLRLADVTAVRIQINETVFGDFSFNIPMSMPTKDLDGNPLNTKDVAVNRAAVGGKTVTNSTIIPFVGPAYARVVPAGSVGVEKSAIIAGQVVNQGPDDATQTLRKGDKLTYVVKAAVDPSGVGVVDPVITEALPAGVELRGIGSNSDGTYDAAAGTWKPGDMNPGDTRTLYLEVEVTGYGDISNVASYPDPQTGDTPAQCAPHTTVDGSIHCDSFTFHVDAGNASISGNAFNDLDWTNTRTEGDAPRPGVTVILNEVLANGTLSPVGQVVTDADGNYTFTDLPGGRYTVEFLTEDGVRYAAANQGTDDTIDSDATLAPDGTLSTGTFRLGETEQKQDVDLGVQPLATVSGLAFHDVNNNGVRDAAEAILPGVKVELLGEYGNASAETAADGTYSFAGIRPGSYTVRFVTPEGYTVAAPGVAADTTAAITDPDRNDATEMVERNDKLVWTVSATRPFDAAIGENPHVDAGFTELGSAEGIFWTDTNGDGIRQSGEDVRPGVTITLFRVLDDGTREQVASATTDENGHYGWYDLPPGNYAPQVTLPEGTIFAPRVDGNPATAAGNDYDDTGLNTGSLPPGAHLKHLDGAIVPLSTVSGIAFWDDNADGKRQDGEAQLPTGQTATIELYKVGQDAPVKTVQAASGAYTFEDVAPGEYYVKVTNLSEGFFSKVVDPDSEITEAGFNDFAQGLASGQTRPFTVVGGTSYPNIDGGIVRKQELSGSIWNDADYDGVRDEDESPRAGVTVTITDALGQVQTTVTDAEGKYSFQGVAIGQATVVFTAPEGTKFTTPDTVTGTVEGSKDVTGVDAGVVTLASISGRVAIDADRDGEIPRSEPGVNDVEVKLFNSAGEEVARATTDEDGRYEFTGVTPGTGYYVVFTQPDGSVFTPEVAADDIKAAGLNDADSAGKTSAFDVANGEAVTNIDAGIINFASISGLVFNDDGAAANNGLKEADESGRPGVPVELLDADGKVVATTVTDENGNYRFDNIAPGDYRIFIDDEHLPSVEISRESYADPNDEGRNNVGLDGRSYLFELTANMDVRNIDAGLVPKAGIAGNVFTDLDRDGKRSADEPGIGGVEVKVFRADDLDTAVATVTTTELGTWFVDKLSFGQEYVVQFVTPDGYTRSVTQTPNEPVSAPLLSDIDESGRTAKFTLGAGQYPNVDAGFILGANISGSVWNDADVDGSKGEGEENVGGVTVELRNADGEVVATTTTAEDGTYSFPNVPVGDYSVKFTAPAGMNFSVPERGTQAVTVIAGEDRTGIDAGLYEMASISGVAFNDVNRDGLRGAAEPVRAGIEVTLKNEFGEDIATAITSEEGSYSFPGLAPGGYFVSFASVDNAAFTDQHVGDDKAIDSDAAINGITDSLEVKAGSRITNVDAGYVVDANISGAVWIDTNNNGIWDEGEQPYQGLEVQIFLHNNDAGTPTEDNWVTQTHTGPLGRYEILDVPAGTYQVRFVTPEGYVFSPKRGGEVFEAGRSDVNTIGELAGFTDTFTLTANRNVPNVDAGIVPTTSLSGMVFTDSDRDGSNVGEQPREGVTVTLLDKDGQEVATAVTAADGTYSFDGLTPGDYTVAFPAAEGEKFSPQDNDSKADEFGRVPVTITAGNPVVGIDAGYINTATISGQVFLDYDGDGRLDNGEPVAPGVTVQLTDADGNLLGAPRSVDADGRYSFNVAPGTYGVAFFNDEGLNVTRYPARATAITVPGYNDAYPDSGKTADFDVAVGETYPNIDAGFTAQGSISGTAFDDVDEDGLRGVDPGVGGVTVELWKDNQKIASTSTDQFGDYVFTGIPSGDYQVRFTAPQGYEFIPNFDGTRAVSLNITAASSTVTDVDAGLRQAEVPPVTTTVTVTAPETTPPVTETVTVTPTETPTDGTVTVTVVVPPTSEPSQPEAPTVTETVTETAPVTTPPVTETVTITPTGTPTTTPENGTVTVTVTEVVPPTSEPGEPGDPEPSETPTETVTVTAPETTPPVTETVTVTPTETPTNGTVTVTVVVPPTSGPSEPGEPGDPEDPEPSETPTVTVTETVTTHPDQPGVTPTATVTIEPTASPTTTPSDGTHTVTATVVVPPTSEPSQPDEPGKPDEPGSSETQTTTKTVVVPPPGSSIPGGGSSKPSESETVTVTVPSGTAPSPAPGPGPSEPSGTPDGNGSTDGGSGSLARTGASVLGIAGLAAVLIVAGALLVRRREEDES